MISALYIEEAVAEHPLTAAIQARFARFKPIPIPRYTEVFNRKAQNFRLQKRRPALILARKHDGFVLPTPTQYGVGAARNFYFSHLLNCVYDCRYCFLQGMYRSAHYVLFVNYEDFQQALSNQIAAAPQTTTFFYSGYDCDSLALEPISGFAAAFLPFFEHHPNAWLELRTKSTQIRSLLERAPLSNVVVAFSFTAEPMASAVEHKVPSIERRIDALAKLQKHGWPIGLRFDPLLYSDDFRQHYRALFDRIFQAIDPAAVHSVSLGPFRLPQSFQHNMRRLYPDEPLLAGPTETRNGTVSYPKIWENALHTACRRELLRYIPADLLFYCDF